MLLCNYHVMKKKKLFDLLIKFGFTQMESDKFTYFKQKDELYVFPKKLQYCHYLATRKQLDMNGWISEGDFNDKFEL